MEHNNLTEGVSSLEVSSQDFIDRRSQQTTLQGLAAYYDGTVTISGPG